jgi:predicted peroxiredoxin
MKTSLHLTILFCLGLFITVNVPSTALASDTAKLGLFVNLTTDDTWAATKAIMFTHQKALKRGHKPAVIWLNVRGIYLADKNRPSHTHGLMDKSIHDMLKDFIKDGGIVIACGACTKAAGLTKDDFIEGVVMGNTELTTGLLFDPNIKTLAW